jgi:ribose transport system substrate-binding protein
MLSVFLLVGCDSSQKITTPANSGAATGAGGAKKLRIAVIPKSTAHVHWTAVKAGADRAASELGNVEIIWKAPVKESDRAAQITLVQQMVSNQVDAIVLAPVDSKALASPVQAATKQGVPVVIIDSAVEGIPGQDFVSYVGTDNTKGGVLGGEALVKALDGKGKVVLMRYLAGSASTMERETGFLSAIEKAPGIELISDNQYAGATFSEAQTKALNMIDVLKQADGIFTPNESSTEGMLLALRKEGIIRKAKFVGFDMKDTLVQALRDGEIDALVAQNPKEMGYQSVMNVVAKMQGKEVPTSVDTGVVVITRDNVDSPEITALMK